MANTPIYGWPYQAMGDEPNGPALGEDLALAIESDVVRVDADLAARARGVVAWARRTTATGPTTAADLGVLRLDSVSLLAGRQYRVWTSPLHLDVNIGNDEARARVRYNIAGTATTASSVLPGTTVHVRPVDANTSEDKVISTTYVPPGNQTMSLLLCVGLIASSGAGMARIANSDGDHETQLVVEDIGPAVTQTGVSL